MSSSSSTTTMLRTLASSIRATILISSWPFVMSQITDPLVRSEETGCSVPSPRSPIRSEVEDNLFLKTVLTGRERIQRNKEIRELPAVPQLVLHKHETLQRHIPRQT